MELSIKACTRCKCEKPADVKHFPPHNRTRDGLDSWCRKCRGSYRSEIRRGHYRGVISDNDLKSLLGKTLECVICGDEFTDSKRKVVDHNHQTGLIRGVLCDHCNRGLGHFKDNPDLLEHARIYLLSSSDDPEVAKYLSAYSTE